MKFSLCSLFATLSLVTAQQPAGDLMALKEKWRKEKAPDPNEVREIARSFTRLTQHRGEIVCGENGMAVGTWECANMNLVSFLSLDKLAPSYPDSLYPGAMTNEVIGWTDSLGKEYMIVGMSHGASVVDISEPTTPEVVGFIPNTEGAVATWNGWNGTGTPWKDFAIFDNILYIAADIMELHGIQVFDLTRLEDLERGGNSKTLEPDFISETGGLHNLILAKGAKKLIGVGISGRDTQCPKTVDGHKASIKIFSLEDPFAPEFDHCVYLPAGKVHDASCVVYHGPDVRYQGDNICVLYGQETSEIVLFNLDTMTQISSFSYDTAILVHQGALSGDHAMLYVNDEFDEYYGTASDRPRTYIFDISDLDAPVRYEGYYDTPTSHPAIDHNMELRGDYIYQAAYTAGARILEISDDGYNLKEVAFFDVENTCKVLNWDDCFPLMGTWTHYPMPSGITLATSVYAGVFILRPTI